MKLSVTQENLSQALAAASRVASTKTQLPILGNILLRTDGNRLLVAATNLEVAVTQYVGAKITTHGSMTVPAKLIAEFVHSLAKGTVELSAQENRLLLSSGGSKSIINGIAADDFPELPVIDEEKAVSYAISTDDFKQAVTQTVLTASSDATRPVLTGVYWHSHDGYLYLAATDGYRLSEKRLMKTTSELAAIIPTASLQEVLRLISDDVQEIDVLFDETQVKFRIGESEVTSRLIDGNFPPYRELIPASSETSVTISKAEFVRITKITSLFARDSGGSITITASNDPGVLALHSIASELGENTSEAPAEVTEGGTVTLNSRYLIDALGVISGDTVEFRFSGKLSPCVLTTVEKDVDYQHIIMPLKS